MSFVDSPAAAADDNGWKEGSGCCQSRQGKGFESVSAHKNKAANLVRQELNVRFHIEGVAFVTGEDNVTGSLSASAC